MKEIKAAPAMWRGTAYRMTQTAAEPHIVIVAVRMAWHILAFVAQCLIIAALLAVCYAALHVGCLAYYGDAACR